MENRTKVVVVGLGEVGRALLKLVSEHYDALGVDIASNTPVTKMDVMHICYPFQIGDFIGESVRYIRLYEPALTIINSTVPIGTTRALARESGASVAYSPVRGKHLSMLSDVQRYVKFVSAPDEATAEAAAAHYRNCRLSTSIVSSPETAELAKLTETTYFGLLISWAQELERACQRLGTNYDEVTSFYQEIPFFPPVKYFPGVIGGHCVMPNIDLLKGTFDSPLIDAIHVSNQWKIEREARKPSGVSEPRTEAKGAA